MRWMASTVTAIDGRVVGDLTAQLLRAVTEPDYELAISMFSDPSFCKSTAACTAFLRVLAECGHGQHLLEVLIDREVAAETQPQMLFRRNTLLTKLVGLYFQLLGHEFLWGVLGPPIESACNSTLLKSNVHDLTPAEQQAHEEEELSLCQQLSDMVVMNVIRFPPTLHRITRYLFLTVEAKFPDFGVTVIRSFVFLRFICLAIIDPHRFGLMDHPATPQITSKLVLVAKMMQRVANLSSRLDPGLSREFIEKNRRSMSEFVQHLASPVPEAASSDRFETPLSEMPDPALILCRCGHVNRWAKTNCSQCKQILSHVHERPDVTLEDDTRTVIAWAKKIVLPLLEATASQPPLDVVMPFNGKEIFLDASAHLHLREVFGAHVPPHLPSVESGGTAVGSGPHPGLSPRHASPVDKFEDLLTQQDLLLLRLLIAIVEEENLELVSSACMLFAVSRGCGLRLAQIQLQQLAKHAGNVDDLLAAFAAEHDATTEHSALVLACSSLVLSYAKATLGPWLRSILKVPLRPGIEETRSQADMILGRMLSPAVRCPATFRKLATVVYSAAEDWFQGSGLRVVHTLFIRVLCSAVRRQSSYGISSGSEPTSDQEAARRLETVLQQVFPGKLHQDKAMYAVNELVIKYRDALDDYFADILDTAIPGPLVAQEEYSALQALPGWTKMRTNTLSVLRFHLLHHFNELEDSLDKAEVPVRVVVHPVDRLVCLIDNVEPISRTGSSSGGSPASSRSSHVFWDELGVLSRPSSREMSRSNSQVTSPCRSPRAYDY